MNSFEANKIFGAVLGTVFVLFGGSLLAEVIFHSEAPERPGFAIEVPEDTGAAAEAPAAVPIAVLMQDADAEAGAAVFKRCQACHSGEKGGPNLVGPDLWDIVNRPIAVHEGFSYSAAMTAFSEDHSVHWDYEHLNGFLHNPRQYVSGTAMSFAGINNDGDRADLIAYLRTLSDNPAPLPEAEAAPAEGGDASAPAEGGDAAAPAEGGNAAAPAEGGDAAAPAESGEAAAPAEGGDAAAPAEGEAPPDVTEPTTTTTPDGAPQQAPGTTDPSTGEQESSPAPTQGAPAGTGSQ
ncbi:c-type cytochrome [Aureimonas altamirensis]|uniref:c-type cytochrome n=1 Tax=Aureimonas altamirensis TaxID=370622 RepID=UPI002553B994|nr:c-type cytochrome [Aureimonas altamirensis]